MLNTGSDFIHMFIIPTAHVVILCHRYQGDVLGVRRDPIWIQVNFLVQGCPNCGMWVKFARFVGPAGTFTYNKNF